MAKTNWSSTINEINRKRYVIPEGWDSTNKVAESLKCDPSKVADILKPGIQSGDIERQQFHVWDESRCRALPIMCYRVRQAGAPKVDTPASLTPDMDPQRVDRIAKVITRFPGLCDSRVAKKLYKVTTQEVAAVRRVMGL
jgi:hypothetical protein